MITTPRVPYGQGATIKLSAVRSAWPLLLKLTYPLSSFLNLMHPAHSSPLSPHSPVSPRLAFNVSSLFRPICPPVSHLHLPLVSPHLVLSSAQGIGTRDSGPRCFAMVPRVAGAGVKGRVKWARGKMTCERRGRTGKCKDGTTREVKAKARGCETDGAKRG
jgi:hypothetical protein